MAFRMGKDDQFMMVLDNNSRTAQGESPRTNSRYHGLS